MNFLQIPQEMFYNWRDVISGCKRHFHYVLCTPILKTESFEFKWLTRFYVKMATDEKLKQRATIKLCVGLGHTPVQTMEMLNRSTKKPSVEQRGCQSSRYEDT